MRNLTQLVRSQPVAIAFYRLLHNSSRIDKWWNKPLIVHINKIYLDACLNVRHFTSSSLRGSLHCRKIFCLADAFVWVNPPQVLPFSRKTLGSFVQYDHDTSPYLWDVLTRVICGNLGLSLLLFGWFGDMIYDMVRWMSWYFVGLVLDLLEIDD